MEMKRRDFFGVVGGAAAAAAVGIPAVAAQPGFIECNAIDDDAPCVDLSFTPDGTRMFVADHQNESILEYSLATPWDISTAYYDPSTIHLVA